MSAHPLRLTVVGCAGSYPGPDSAASCYLLEAEHLCMTIRGVLKPGTSTVTSSLHVTLRTDHRSRQELMSLIHRQG